MSELPLPQDPPPLGAHAPDAAVARAPVSVDTVPPAGATGAPLSPPPAMVPPEMAAFLELIGRGLTPDADDTTRAMARELWARCAHAIVGAAIAPAHAAYPVPAPVAPPAFAPVAMTVPTAAAFATPALPAAASPIAMAAQTLRGMSADQLLAMALQRLRGALPPGTTVSEPKGIQFQLLPITTPR